MKLADINSCTGCGACASVCSLNCISMTEDQYGFFVPCVDEKKCIDCGACERVCHVFKEHDDIVNKSTFYAAWSKNNDNRNQGSSGGIFGEIADWIIKNDGVVFGAALSEDCKQLNHTDTTQVSLQHLKKSKYFESNMGLTIRHMKNFLDKGKWVLFCGTPCQAMGVRTVFGDKYDKLVILDFLCHGVPSQKAYQKYISNLEKKYKSTVNYVSFRSKKLGWKLHCMYITFKNGKTYLKSSMEDPFYKLFLRNLSLRNACYTCNRARFSDADITLGDFWGITNTNKLKDTDQGFSFVSIHNQQGSKFFDLVNDMLNVVVLDSADVSYCYKNRSLSIPNQIDFNNFDFFNNNIIKKSGFANKIKCLLFRTKLTRNIIYKIKELQK